mgnify:CR=1 FL=1
MLAASVAGAYPLLAVVPNVVKMNWAREVERWTPQRRATVIHGDGDQVDAFADVFIVNYEVLDRHLSWLGSLGLKGMVVDEAHFIKNLSSQRSQNVLALASRIREQSLGGQPLLMALTGTPLINDVEDFDAIWRFLGWTNGERPCGELADKLDAIGAIGVARAVAYSATHGHRLWSEPLSEIDPQNAPPSGIDYSPSHEFIYKLARLQDQLITPTARRLAERKLTEARETDALSGGVAVGLSTLLAVLTVVAVTAVTIPAVHSGDLNGVLLAALALLALASFEPILPLGQAAAGIAAGQHQREGDEETGDERAIRPDRCHSPTLWAPIPSQAT